MTEAGTSTGPETLTPDNQTTRTPADSWVFSSGASSSGVHADWAGGCAGGFVGPTLFNGNTAFQWGAQTDCSQTTVIRVGMQIDKCVRDGGPSDFDCSVIAYNPGNQVAQFYAVTYAQTNCSGTAEYRPTATDITINHVDYGDVEGNPVQIACA
ncbi:MAG TPA: hypothetical protein VGC45_02895 [Gryllotalpicola sp.]